MQIKNLIIKRNNFNQQFYFNWLKDGFVLHWWQLSVIYGKSIGKRYKHLKNYQSHISKTR